MKSTLKFVVLGFAMASSMPAFASPSNTTESALSKFCEPLIAGSAAAQITKAAKSAGFKNDQVSGQPVLIDGELILSVSDVPRVCFIQAPTNMTFTQGVSLVDAWAARNPGAMRGAATKGPDGAPVRMWAVPKQRKYLLVSQQTNARGQTVLNFILAPLPTS